MPRAGLLFLLILFACRPAGGARGAGAGELEARWSDTSGTARLIAPAAANWCPRDSMLEILAVHNDSAVGIALFARDSLRAEGYPVFPVRMFSASRPQATAALRLVTLNAIKGFESARGQVSLSEAGRGWVSGTFDLHLRRSTAVDSLQVTGRFTRLAIRPAAPSCGRANQPAIR
ncbi:MAG TPA: hypothetical protein VGQ69_15325 [Gemmatimonadales bacterium]|jgi:hypothetical protein|nr:hypothetical protein [Gemmatimonadales bacterium]